MYINETFEIDATFIKCQLLHFCSFNYAVIGIDTQSRPTEKVETYKAGRIVVFDSLGVTKRLQDGVGLQQLLLQLPLVDKQGT